MFRLVKNTVIVIGWLATPGHSWFGKHELRQIKHLMGNLGHPHIFTAMSQMSLDPGVGTSDIQYDAPRVSSYDTPSPSTRVSETHAPSNARHERPHREIRPRDTYARHERPHREIRPRDTYSLSLIRKMFRRRWCIFFQRLLFIWLFFYFLVYDFKFNFSYLCFDIKFL
jgi:hypothetical protein